MPGPGLPGLQVLAALKGLPPPQSLEADVLRLHMLGVFLGLCGEWGWG